MSVSMETGNILSTVLFFSVSWKRTILKVRFYIFTISVMEIGKILKRVDLTWFTELVYGDHLRRYVVGLTNNTVRTEQILQDQIEAFKPLFDNLTLGWRRDPQGVDFIDVWTSTDSLVEARRLQKLYNQQAIRDRLNEEEV